ncbi:MAG: hypothetical protein P1P88_07940, partial [Bacteroidales bacterium]|nr:hypothetical protein [Bacteroidales bacterium]
MKNTILLFIQISLILTSAWAQKKENKQVDIVLLGAYQMESCNWTELENKFYVKKAIIRDFTSHQYEWILNELVIKYHPHYCIIHAGIEDF